MCRMRRWVDRERGVVRSELTVNDAEERSSGKSLLICDEVTETNKQNYRDVNKQTDSHIKYIKKEKIKN